MKKISLVIGLLASTSCWAAGEHAFATGVTVRDWGQAMARWDSHTGSTEDYAKSQQLLGYVQAAIDTYSMLGLICMPDGTPIRKPTSTVIQFVEMHPEYWEKSGVFLVNRAMYDDYACPHWRELEGKRHANQINDAGSK